MVSIAIENIWAKVTDASDADIRWLDGILCYESWSNNGLQTYRLYDNFNKRFLAGLVPQVMKRAVQDKFEGIVLTDRRVPPCAPDPTADLGWLRDYQLEAVDTVVRRTRGILHLPTAAGKSEIAVGLTQRLPCRWLMLAHRAMLTENIADRYNKRTGAKAGRIADGVWEEGDGALVCATFQALAAGLKKGNQSTLDLILGAQGIIVDECFPAGTLVGDKRIEDIRVGDYVPSFDTETGRLCAAPVVRVLRNMVRGLVRVRLENGHAFVCTPTHKVWTSSGWSLASELTKQHAVTTYVGTSKDLPVWRLPYSGSSKDVPHKLRTVLQGLPQTTRKQSAESSYPAVRDLRSTCDAAGPERLRTSQNRPRILWTGSLQTMVPREAVEAKLGYSNTQQSAACCANARSKSDMDARCKGEDGGDAAHAGGELETAHTRRERPRPHKAASSPRTAVGMANRGCRAARAEETRSANLLQNRHSPCTTENCDRDRRQHSQEPPSEIGRRTQDARTEWARVDRVEILESGSDGTFGGLCPEGVVYDLEIEGTHTYFADGVGVSNCHTAPADSYRRIIGMARNAYYRAGLSGTPLARTDHRSVFAIGSIGRVIYRVKTETLIEAGLISKPTIVMHACEQTSEREDWAGVHRELIVNSKERNKLIVAMTKEAPKPCIVFVSSLRHGKALTKTLQAAGLKSEFADGKSSLDMRKRAVKRLEDCSVEALVATTIFNEGIDIPSLAAVVIAAGGASAIQALQRIGRGMRRTVEKDTFHVYDIADKGHRWTERHAQARARAYRSEGHEVAMIK